jgi:hypothetical protein
MPRSAYQTNYYIIEHPTRGTLREMEYEHPIGEGIIGKARFSTTGARTDSEKAQQFGSVDAAQTIIDRITDGKVASTVRVRRATDWKALCPYCGEWAEYWHEHAHSCRVYIAEVESHNR